MPTMAASMTFGSGTRAVSGRCAFAERLPPDLAERLKRDVDAYHRHYAVAAGLHVKRVSADHWPAAVSTTRGVRCSPGAKSRCDAPLDASSHPGRQRPSLALSPPTLSASAVAGEADVTDARASGR
jgi:hypothetical protein